MVPPKANIVITPRCVLISLVFNCNTRLLLGQNSFLAPTRFLFFLFFSFPEQCRSAPVISQLFSLCEKRRKKAERIFSFIFGSTPGLYLSSCLLFSFPFCYFAICSFPCLSDQPVVPIRLVLSFTKLTAFTFLSFCLSLL